MPDQTNTPTRFVGCDVGKALVAVYDSATGMVREWPNTTAAMDQLAATFDAATLAVCEATGGYEANLLDALTRAGVAVHRADARKVKAFIRSFGTLAKTDAIDATALARYAKERHDRLTRWQPCKDRRAELHTLVATRSDLVRSRAAHANRLKSPTAAPVQSELLGLLGAYEQAIAILDQRIANLIETTHELATKARILQAMPGIGPTTAAALLAYMPELGTLGRKQAASLAGLAPHPRQSGNNNAYRRTTGGRPELKRALPMAALSAVRFSPNLKSFHQRLIANGKKPIVALVAAMRKLITIANAKIRDGLTTQLS
ncbi:IS110 family transposase [Novosphingobium sp.]|uniref:IS110 family transposase n=1 Tax=Novosphingobium sp. TaxID=1874826 RepID=UPI001DCC989C|nr:IS110 family transposase [Novosphingobium sp.]MBX9662028.1 IS110 family transposase [Novosphingobium sp.]